MERKTSTSALWQECLDVFVAVPGGPCDGAQGEGEITVGGEFQEELEADYIGPLGQ